MREGTLTPSKPRLILRLENWGRYWRDRSGHFDGHCRSIEHRYVPSEHERGAILDAEARQERKVIPPDMQDAHTVNDAWKRCTSRTKNLLKWSYCMGRVNWDFVARRCGVTVDVTAFETAMAKAQREIAWLLDERNFFANDARNSSSGAALRTPVSSETERPRRGSLTPKETEETD